MTILTIHDHARLEIDRRGLSKDNPARRYVGGDKDLPLASEATTLGCFRLGKADLASLAQTVAQAKAPAVKAARPKGPGSRGGDPVKAARAKIADQAVANLPGGKAGNMGAWWVAYRASK